MPNELVDTESVKIITDFLSGTFPIYLILFFLVWKCHPAISNLIQRFTNVIWKTPDSEIGFSAAEPENLIKNSNINPALQPPDEPKAVIDETHEEVHWHLALITALKEGKIDEAKAVFKKYQIEEKDPKEFIRNKAFYLYYLFSFGKDNSAIEDLETLAAAEKDDEAKSSILFWLSFAYNDGSQTQKTIDLWTNAISEFTSEKHVTTATINLATELNQDDKSNEAKNLIVSRLLTVSEESERAKLYLILAKIEASLGNIDLSVFCKDKALELDPNNREELFRTAYEASKEDIEGLSISNYNTLLKIDPYNSVALNNLAIHAQNMKLHIIAVEKFKESEKFENTLAMANQGFSLLDAGFVVEAEELAKKALKMENPHENIHSLLIKIKKLQTEQDNSWTDKIGLSIEHQKFIRKFTIAYYEGNPFNFSGSWETENGDIVEVTLKENKLDIKWEKFLESALAMAALGGARANLGKNVYSISGTLNNLGFRGRYNKKEERTTKSILAIPTDKVFTCIGVISNKGSIFKIVSEKYSDNFFLTLKKKI